MEFIFVITRVYTVDQVAIDHQLSRPMHHSLYAGLQIRRKLVQRVVRYKVTRKSRLFVFLLHVYRTLEVETACFIDFKSEVPLEITGNYDHKSRVLPIFGMTDYGLALT